MARIPVRWLLLAALLAAAWIVIGASGAHASDGSRDLHASPQSRAVDHPRELVPGQAEGADRLRSQVGKTVDSKVAEPLGRMTQGLADGALPSSDGQRSPARAAHDQLAGKAEAVTSPADQAMSRPAPDHVVTVETVPEALGNQGDSSDSPMGRGRRVEATESAPGPVERTSEPAASSTAEPRAAESSDVANPVVNEPDSPQPLAHSVSAAEDVLVKATPDVRNVTRSLPTATVTESPLGADLQDRVQRTVSATSSVTRHWASTVDDQVMTTAAQVDRALAAGPVVHRLLGDRPVSTLLAGTDRAVTTALGQVTQATDSALDRTTTVVSQEVAVSPAIPEVLPDVVSAGEADADAPARSSAHTQGQQRPVAVDGAARAAQSGVGSWVTAGSNGTEPAAAGTVLAGATAPVAAMATPTAPEGPQPVEGSARPAASSGMPQPVSPRPVAPVSPMAGVGGSASEAGAGGGAAPVSIPPSVTSNGGLIELFSVSVQDWALPNSPSHNPGSSPD